MIYKREYIIFCLYLIVLPLEFCSHDVILEGRTWSSSSENTSLFVINTYTFYFFKSEIELLFFILYKIDAFSTVVFNKRSKLITTPHVPFTITGI